jgi:DNA-binding NtrC family response regulator
MTTNRKAGSILVVDDDEGVLQAARLFLKQHAARVDTERSPENLPGLLQNARYDVILLDMNFTRDSTSGQEGFFWLDRILALDPGAVVVLITAFGDVDMAVSAIKAGATDFILKPWQNEKLLATVCAALSLRRSRDEAEHLRSGRAALAEAQDLPFHEFVGDSPEMRRVYEAVQKVAGTEASVLILGENGTGKELVARALHRASARAGEVFISVDMGAITETLFESELFGHVKGAFTDARSDRAGRFEAAAGGTLFLDEIGNLPLPLQARILRALETRQVVRVGSNRPCPFDVRLICASNKPVHAMADRGEFRQDLLYRINTVEIHLPPLRDRGGDLPQLVEHFLRRYARKYGKPVRKVSDGAFKKLQAYRWPGNVRELEHAIERAVILSDTAVLQPGDFLFPSPRTEGAGLVFDTYNLEEVEKAVIRRTLEKHHGNITGASRELGLTRASLYRRMEKHGI